MGSFLGRPRLALIVIVCVAAGVAAAAGYAQTAPKRYRATARLLVAPAASEDAPFAGLGVLRVATGKRASPARVAALLRRPQVAQAVSASLGLHRSPGSLEKALHLRVESSRDAVDVTGEDTTATGAAELANSFAAALISQLGARFQAQVSNAVHREEERLAPMNAADRKTAAGVSAARRLTALKRLLGKPDPTVRIASEAASPSAASWPNLARFLELGAVGGAVAGLVLALVLLGCYSRRRAFARI